MAANENSQSPFVHPIQSLIPRGTAKVAPSPHERQLAYQPQCTGLRAVDARGTARVLLDTREAGFLADGKLLRVVRLRREEREQRRVHLHHPMVPDSDNEVVIPNNRPNLLK